MTSRVTHVFVIELMENIFFKKMFCTKSRLAIPEKHQEKAFIARHGRIYHL